MLRYIYIYSFIIISFACKTQNLIINGSFETTTNIVCNAGPIQNLNNWSIISSPDYYSTICNGIGEGVPYNYFGSSFPKDGNAYVGIGTIGYPYEVKECIYQHLQSPLIAGKSYYTSFFLSKSDRTRIATEKIGAYFSLNQPSVASGTVAFLATPQVENHSDFLTDTVNWIKIEGYFTAEGGEQYMTIGNFNSNANTDTLFTGTNNPFFADAGTAYYYIDSVSLYDSLDYVTNIKNHENDFKLNLYPNPSKGLMALDYDLGNNLSAKLNLYDVTGKLISSYKLDSNKGILQMNEQNLNNGVYFYHILVGEKTIKTDKIVIIK